MPAKSNVSHGDLSWSTPPQRFATFTMIWPQTLRSEPISYEVGEFEALARLAFNIRYRF